MRALCRKLLVTCITFQMGMSQASTSWMCQHKMYATRWENISQCCRWISCFLLIVWQQSASGISAHTDVLLLSFCWSWWWLHSSVCPHRFLELQFPQRSKVLRTGAFVLPFIFDTVPLFYRVSVSIHNFQWCLHVKMVLFSDWMWNLNFHC